MRSADTDVRQPRMRSKSDSDDRQARMRSADIDVRQARMRSVDSDVRQARRGSADIDDRSFSGRRNADVDDRKPSGLRQSSGAGAYKSRASSETHRSQGTMRADQTDRPLTHRLAARERSPVARDHRSSSRDVAEGDDRWRGRSSSYRGGRDTEEAGGVYARLGR